MGLAPECVQETALRWHGQLTDGNPLHATSICDLTHGATFFTSSRIAVGFHEPGSTAHWASIGGYSVAILMYCWLLRRLVKSPNSSQALLAGKPPCGVEILEAGRWLRCQDARIKHQAFASQHAGPPSGSAAHRRSGLSWIRFSRPAL